MIIIYTMKDFIQIITEIFIRITLGVISLQDISTYNANVFPTIRVLEETLTRLKITETKNKIFHFIILYYNLMPFVQKNQIDRKYPIFLFFSTQQYNILDVIFCDVRQARRDTVFHVFQFTISRHQTNSRFALPRGKHLRQVGNVSKHSKKTVRCITFDFDANTRYTASRIESRESRDQLMTNRWLGNRKRLASSKKN